MDEDGLTESSRHVALLLITDDDSKITELQCMLQYLGHFVLGAGVGVACDPKHTMQAHF